MSTFRIQEFARPDRVTVRTLHHYDRLSSDPRVEEGIRHRRKNGAQRSELATLFDSGELKSFVKAELPLETPTVPTTAPSPAIPARS